MKFKLVESFPGQTKLKQNIIENSIDKRLQPLSKEEQTDCRYADIHHINSKHNQHKNNLMLIPHSVHSELTTKIDRANRKDVGLDYNLISTKVTLDYVLSNDDLFEAISTEQGVVIVWKYYLYENGKHRPEVQPVPLTAAIDRIKDGKDFNSDQMSLFDNKN